MPSKFEGLAKSGAPARMTVMNPDTGETLIRNDTGEACWIEAHASQSKRGSEVDRELRTKAMRRRVMRMSAKEIDENVNQKLALLTTGWSLALLDGTPIDIPFSPEDALELYSLPNAEWLRDQLSIFVAELGNFPATSSGTS